MCNQIKIASIYSHGRILQPINDGSSHINNLKDQLVALELQVRHKDRHIKHLRYLIRCAKRFSEYCTVRKIEAQLIIDKHQLKVLKNRRNCMYNRLGDNHDFWSRRYAPKVCKKSERLRASRLQRDAQSQV